MFNFSATESVTLSNGETIHYLLKRRQRRSLGLKITFDGLVVHAPFLMSKNKINALLLNKTKWLLSKIRSIEPSPPSLTYKENDSDAQVKQFFHRWLKQYALDFFSERVQFYCKKNGFTSGKVFISNAKTRWGTCNSKTDIRLNWRLIQAPLDIIDYVICHELSHTRFMNHSHQFWHLVSSVCPNYKVSETYLKNQGLSLYRLD